MKNIYILLTRSQTLLSRAIHKVTGDEYTHVSIAYDDELKTLCSFARIYSSFPLPAGLVNENLYEGYYEQHRYIPCMLLRLEVPDKIHTKIERKLKFMLSVRKMYRYNAIGLLMCKIGIEKKTTNRYFCSQFVAEIIQKSEAFALPKAPSLMRPQDFLEIKELDCIYKGILSGLMHENLPIENKL